MEGLELTNERVRRYVPIAQSYPEGYFEAFARPAHMGLLGQIVDLGRPYGELLPVAGEALEAAAVYSAVMAALPYMDVNMTQSGFTVVQTDNLTPASKARVERVVEDLRDKLYEACESILHSGYRWRLRHPGAWPGGFVEGTWLSRLLCNPRWCTLGKGAWRRVYFEGLDSIASIENRSAVALLGRKAGGMFLRDLAWRERHPELHYTLVKSVWEMVLHTAGEGARYEAWGNASFRDAKRELQHLVREDAGSPLVRAYVASEAYDEEAPRRGRLPGGTFVA